MGKKKYVVFQLTNQRFALPLTVVEQVVQVVEICPWPKMPDYIHGIINLHGEIIPVINIHFLFGLPAKEIELSDQLIIAATSSRKLAILVNSSHEVLELEDDKVVNSDKIMFEMIYIQGVMKLENGMVLINNIEEFLCPENLRKLEESLKKFNKSEGNNKTI